MRNCLKHTLPILLLTICLMGCNQTITSPSEKSETCPTLESTLEASNQDLPTSAFPQIPAWESPQSLSAMEFVADMGIGWNLGNSFDPVDCTWLSDEMDYETAWDNPKVTRELIHFIKEQGFDTIRIPVTWTNHVGSAPVYTISTPWLDRIQEVVDWCIEEDLYVILNIHHESGWLTKASTDYEDTMTKYKAIWAQIAECFGNYPDKLLFESMNEIGFDDLGPEQGCELMNRINNEFTELIRNSSSNNANRYLILAGYWTDIDLTCKGITLPDDNRVILSVHYYSPSDFCIAEADTDWGYRSTWGTEEDFTYMENQFQKLQVAFLDQDIPVIMTEFGCIIKDKDPESRSLYLSSVANYCRRYGICPIFWDNGEEIDRTNLRWRTEDLSKQLMQ